MWPECVMSSLYSLLRVYVDCQHRESILGCHLLFRSDCVNEHMWAANGCQGQGRNAVATARERHTETDTFMLLGCHQTSHIPPSRVTTCPLCHFPTTVWVSTVGPHHWRGLTSCRVLEFHRDSPQLSIHESRKCDITNNLVTVSGCSVMTLNSRATQSSCHSQPADNTDQMGQMGYVCKYIPVGQSVTRCGKSG